MKQIRIDEKISYIECSEDPLSADIGIIREGEETWLYDVGNGENHIPERDNGYQVVLSHFHQDHIANFEKVNIRELYVSKETFKHTKRGRVVSEDITIGDLRIFSIPSCHAKGCLGLEVDRTFAFVGDALYSKVKGEYFVYNTQLLREEIKVLKNLQASYLLVSHYKGLIRNKEDVIAELEEIYRQRKQNSPEIEIKRERK